MAVGIAPDDVLVLDAPMFDALEAEAARDRERWSTDRELAAQLVELTSAQLVAFLAAHSKPSAKLPAPLRIPRPGVEGDGDTTSSSPARPGAFAFAQRFAPKVSTSGAA